MTTAKRMTGRGDPAPTGDNQQKPAKILCFTPTYGAGPQTETLASVQAQTYRDLTHEVSWANPYPGGDMRNVLAQFQRGRQMVLDGGYAALWTVEHDMAVPPDALQKLWDTGAQVAYGVYVLRHGVAVINAWEWLGEGSVNIGESLSLHPKQLAAARKQEIVQVGGVGFGCTLIRAETLRTVPFVGGGSGSEPPDMPFALACIRAGVKQLAHFGVLCGHWDGEVWLRPFEPEASCLSHVRANQNVTVRVGGETRVLVAGQIYELPDRAELLDLQRAGYVTLVDTAPALAVAPALAAERPAKRRAA
jgi:hypothetical protein